jgi:hypothetical protein
MAQNEHDLEKELKELDPIDIETNNPAPQEAIASPAQSRSSDSIYDDGDTAGKHYDIEKRSGKFQHTAQPALSRKQTNATGITEISQTTQATQLPKRSLWKRLNPLKRHPPPVPDKRGQSREYTAGFFSLLTFQWITPLMTVRSRYFTGHAPDTSTNMVF